MSKANVILLGEAWGEQEAKIKQAFVGPTGIELLRMLNDAKMITLTHMDYQHIGQFYRRYDPIYIDQVWKFHPQFYRTNVFNLRPPNNKLENICGPKDKGIPGYPSIGKSKYVPKVYTTELERLGDEIASVDPNLIICLGNTALWALSGFTGIGKLRGSTRLSTRCIAGYKLLPTYHPSAVLHQYELRPTTVADLMKAKREADFPDIRRPPRSIWIDPTLEDMETFYERYIRDSELVAVDIETSGRYVTCIGFSPRPDVAIVVPFVDGRKKDRNYWPNHGEESRAWGWVTNILGDKTIKKVFQNGPYDIAFLFRSAGVITMGAEHDTMFLCHALYPESLKGLGYLGSLYTDEGSWKEMRKAETIKKDD